VVDNRRRFSFSVEEFRLERAPGEHPPLFEPVNLAFALIQGMLGAIIGLELLTRVGVTPNTAVIGAIVAIGVARIPLAACAKFRSLDRQNLMQTVISSATFGGANAVLLPMGVLWLLGRVELVPAMFLGACVGMFIGGLLLYRLFDTRAYPASGAWPPGVATAECMIAGDQGGRRAVLLALGAGVGAVGRYFGLPMDIWGTCWIGNIWALTMFALGLLISGYADALLGFDLNQLYLPHGLMIGAGGVAVVQMGRIILRSRRVSARDAGAAAAGGDLVGAVGQGLGLLTLGAIVLALLGGLQAQISPGMLAGFVAFAALSALVSQLIVGVSAMHSGWFPAFATALIFLLISIALGFPPLASAFLVGFTASTGPAFADMGYDLKTGWIIRGSGRFPEYERQGRKQQLAAALLGFAIAAAVVLVSYKSYFRHDLLPPVDRVFVATIRAGARLDVARLLLLWAVPGAIIQLAGGTSRQIGILLATGLLIGNPIAGWTALFSLATRMVFLRRYGRAVESPMYVLAGGFIAGSALTSFATATLRLRPSPAGNAQVPGIFSRTLSGGSQ
jgi:uncharacterized oligopeptide transporter (OPT) family protein